ncbi:MAG: biotin--[acetyl-CoA-carboxylase] ligase, partial [Bacteroidales bacterium]|nr:biotin--[acetyl-CoA-carboxylase] ligase [Bacteroidales bacterium]
MTSPIIGIHRIQLEKVQSTNDYALKLLTNSLPEEGTIIIANNQTMGKGLAGNRWESQAGKNITISIILKPFFLNPSKQFYISKIVAISVSNFLNDLIKNIRIK